LFLSNLPLCVKAREQDLFSFLRGFLVAKRYGTMDVPLLAGCGDDLDVCIITESLMERSIAFLTSQE
jgi:hypothetical protein